jgi:hypothetical protein
VQSPCGDRVAVGVQCLCDVAGGAMRVILQVLADAPLDVVLTLARGRSSSSRASIALSRAVTSLMNSGSCSRSGGVGWRRRAASIRDAVTAAMITVRKAMPLIITNAPITRPVPLLGTTSPYPTVVTVCRAHHSPSPRLPRPQHGGARSATPPRGRARPRGVSLRAPRPLRRAARGPGPRRWRRA